MVKNDFHKRDKRTGEPSYLVAVHEHGTTVNDTATAPPYVMTIPDPHGTRIFPGSLNFSLRHEVARLIVWHAVSTRPVVPSTVSYEEVREGNDPYRALGHGTHSSQLAPEP